MVPVHPVVITFPEPDSWSWFDRLRHPLPDKLALDSTLSLSTLWSASQTKPVCEPYISKPSMTPSAPEISIAGPL